MRHDRLRMPMSVFPGAGLMPSPARRLPRPRVLQARELLRELLHGQQHRVLRDGRELCHGAHGAGLDRRRNRRARRAQRQLCGPGRAAERHGLAAVQPQVPAERGVELPGAPPASLSLRCFARYALDTSINDAS